jgi:hypothetical protein
MMGPSYKPGDRVHVRIGRDYGRGGGISRRVWTVRTIDTNRTPARDHEPAYELRYGPNGYSTRYAYESDLYPAGDQ